MIQMIKNSSVIPAGPNIRYHLIANDWFEAWIAFTNSRGSEPGPINQDS